MGFYRIVKHFNMQSSGVQRREEDNSPFSSSAVVTMVEDLELTKALLQDRLRSLGCAFSGNKSELIQQLREKYVDIDAELEAESERDGDDDQYADKVEEIMEYALAHREEGMKDEDAEFDYKDVRVFGTFTVRKLMPKLSFITIQDHDGLY